MRNSHNDLSDELREEIAKQIIVQPALSAFSQLQVDFLDKLSLEILRGPGNRSYSDLMTFGYFIRKANIQRYLEGRHPAPTYVATGVGSALHVAPSNIPINFAYSWLFGFLAGCKNLVRLPSAPSDQIALFLKSFETVALLPQFAVVSQTNYFFRSERGSSEFDKLIPCVDAVLIWGGDSTVQYFRQLVESPTTRQLLFPSRQSSLVLSAPEVNAVLQSPRRDDFLRKAFNDTFLTDCNACSSPSKIFFVGEAEDCVHAAEMFFSGLNQYVLDRERSLPIVHRMIDSLGSDESSVDWGKSIAHDFSIREIRLEGGSSYLKRPLRFGAFVTKNTAKLRDITSFLSDNEQTIIHWGFSAREVRGLSPLIDAVRSSASRVVPLGSALDMGFFWEGRDNPSHLVKYKEVVTSEDEGF